MSGDKPLFTFAPPPPLPPVAGATEDEDGDEIALAVAQMPTNTTPMPVVRPPLSDAEYERGQGYFRTLLLWRDASRIAHALASGDYDRFSALGDNRHVAHRDLFASVLADTNEPGTQFNLDALDVFVRDGRVFRNAYGLLSLLGRTWFHARAIFFILLSHIPDVTWRQMAMALLEHADHTRFRFESFYLPMLVTTVWRYGRHALTLDLVVRIDALFDAAYQAASGSVYHSSVDAIYQRLIDGYRAYDPAEVELPTSGDALATLLAVQGSEAYRDGIARRIDRARRRFCRDEIVAFVLGMANTTLDPEALIQIARFALPCFDERIMRIDMTRVVDRVRARIWARAATNEARSGTR